LRAIITIEATDDGYQFTVAHDGKIALSGTALTFAQAWEFCSVWADGAEVETE